MNLTISLFFKVHFYIYIYICTYITRKYYLFITFYLVFLSYLRIFICRSSFLKKKWVWLIKILLYYKNSLRNTVFLEVKLHYAPVQSVGRLVSHNFLTGREVSFHTPIGDLFLSMFLYKVVLSMLARLQIIAYLHLQEGRHILFINFYSLNF